LRFAVAVKNLGSGPSRIILGSTGEDTGAAVWLAPVASGGEFFKIAETIQMEEAITMVVINPFPSFNNIFFFMIISPFLRDF
jgi:hypothetical protein